MKIAVEGCSHGELDAIYASILLAESKKNFKTDLLLLCGDFQAIRNKADLQCLAVPEKFRQLGGFHRYYSGEKVAPLLTIVIGGNHEASNYMWELFHGGWIAPNIYYLGSAGCIEVGGLRIGGISGIYKEYDYPLGRFERMPYSKSDIRSIYHTRLYDVLRLKLLSSPSDSPTIVLSHDWPNKIERSGNFKSLLKKKNFFTDEVREGNLGSPPLMELMKTLKPKYWFSAHLHVKFSCIWKFKEMEKKELEMDWGKDGWVHKSDDSEAKAKGTAKELGSNLEEKKSFNPEVLEINDDVDDEMMENGEPPHQHEESETKENPDEIEIDFEEEEEEESNQMETDGNDPKKLSFDQETIDLPTTSNQTQDSNFISESSNSIPEESTRFLALSKCLPNQEFLQFLDIPSPYDDYLSSISSTSTSNPNSNFNSGEVKTSDSKTSTASTPTFQGSKIPLPIENQRRFPPLRFNKRWLAITRTLHPFLCLERIQKPALPNFGDSELEGKIKEQEIWIEQNLIKIKEKETEKKSSEVDEKENGNQIEIDNHPLAIGNVQGFVKTAPTPNEPGGHENGPPPWYTNPQTESFCAFLQVPNLINPSPHQQPIPPTQAQALPSAHQQTGNFPQVSSSFNLLPPTMGNQSGFRLGNLLPAEGSSSLTSPTSLPQSQFVPQAYPQHQQQPPKAPSKDREAEEIAKIKESAERRKKEREELKEKIKKEAEK